MLELLKQKVNKKLSIHFLNTCIYIKGYNRGLIYDIDRQTTFLVDLSIISFIEKNNNKSVEDFISEIKLFENKSKLEDWLNFLYENDLFTFLPKDQIQNFPEVNLEFNEPSLISNAILKNIEKNNLNDVFEWLDNSGCEAVQVQFFSNYKINDLLNKIIEINELFQNRGIKHLEIIFNINGSIKNKVEFINSINLILKSKKNRINFIYIGNYDIEKHNIKLNKDIITKQELYTNGILEHNKVLITDEFKVFLEAHNFNSYHNKKIVIDGYQILRSDGFTIANFIEGQQIINGRIKNKENLDFWEISKNKILVCNNCEFRYNCLDKRVPILHDSKMYFYETECNYNPFISKWIDEDDFKTLNQIGVNINQKEFSIDHGKIALINKELWEDE